MTLPVYIAEKDEISILLTIGCTHTDGTVAGACFVSNTVPPSLVWQQDYCLVRQASSTVPDRLPPASYTGCGVTGTPTGHSGFSRTGSLSARTATMHTATGCHKSTDIASQTTVPLPGSNFPRRRDHPANRLPSNEISFCDKTQHFGKLNPNVASGTMLSCKMRDLNMADIKWSWLRTCCCWYATCDRLISTFESDNDNRRLGFCFALFVTSDKDKVHAARRAYGGSYAIL